jgi:hypothetical protein
MTKKKKKSGSSVSGAYIMYVNVFMDENGNRAQFLEVGNGTGPGGPLLWSCGHWEDRPEEEPG